MAIFGSLGSALGLGSAQQIVTQATGSTVAGRVAGLASKTLSDIGRRAVSSEQGQSTAVSIAPPPAESAMSGERGPIQAAPFSYSPGIQPAVFRSQPPMAGSGQGMVQQAALPAIISGGTAVARGLGGMLALGGGAIAVAPIIIDQFGNEKKLRVTRRLRSQVKKAVEMFGVEAVADQMGTDVDVVFYILTKKMRNDGPYVTKAAVRKTRQTVRKMKHLCDMYDDLRPAAKRRAPTRRASSVTQIKN